MKLVALPAFTDNYIWMIHDGREALVVDPGDAAPVLQTLQDLGLTLAAILVTHHHHDHIMGLDPLRERFDGPIYGPERERIAQVTHPVGEGSEFTALGMRFTVWDTPGHRAAHVAYLTGPSPGTPWPAQLLLPGDTIFSAGCGRVFDGSLETLFASLERINTLPDDTWVCPTHEYTVSNLTFSKAVEPDNARVDETMARCLALLARGEPTLPTTIGLERAINPFLRIREPAVQACALHHGAPDSSPQSVFNALRLWKNQYKA
jgi:hydroxyacylglutathione hydrolase